MTTPRQIYATRTQQAYTIPQAPRGLREDDVARRRLQQKGDLTRQGGYWKLRWREDQTLADGTLKRAWSRAVFIGPCAGAGALTEKQATRFAWDNFLSRLDQNNTVPMSVMTVAQFVERRFMPGHVAMLKQAGRAHYTAMLKRIMPALGSTRLRDVRKDDVQRLVAGVLAEGRAVQTALHVKNAVSAIFTHAEGEECFTGTNPAKHVRLPEMVRREPHALSWDQARAVLAALASPAREMALAMILLSCNVSELLGLQWKRLNLTDGWSTADVEALPPWTLAVRRQWYRGGYGSCKAKARERLLQIPAPLRSVLIGMRQRATFAAPDDPVFCGRTGKPLDEHNYAVRRLKPVGIAMGMPWLSWHVFRRTHATLTKAVGLSDHDRMRMMGHSSIALTDRYTASEAGDQGAALELIAERLMGTTHGGVQ